MIFYLTFLFLCLNANSKEVSQELLLFRELFHERKIDPNARPVRNKSHPVDVKINVAYVQIVSLDDRDQSLKSNIWIRQFWKNELLTWDPKNFGGVEELVVDKRYVWKPDLVLYNSADDSLNGQLDQYKTRIKVRYDGENIWYIPTIIISGCSINIQYFPFDYQVCELKFGSWSYLGPELNLTNTRDDLDLNSYQESPQFWLLGTRAVKNVVYYSCCPDPYIDVTFTMVLHRQAGHYVFNVIMPSFVLTFFALFIFAYPEQTGERMGLAIQCFLTISILTMMVSDMMPIDSNVTPLLASFMLICITAMTLSIVMNAVRSNMERTIPVPAWLHDLAFNKIGPAILYRSCVSKISRRGICNPFAFCECLFGASIRKEMEERIKATEERERLTNIFNENFYDGTPGMKRKSHHDYETIDDFQLAGPYNSMRLFDDLSRNEKIKVIRENAVDIENVELLASKVREELEGDIDAEFWRCFCKTVDRFFLILFFLVYVIVALVLFFQVPTENLIL